MLDVNVSPAHRRIPKLFDQVIWSKNFLSLAFGDPAGKCKAVTLPYFNMQHEIYPKPKSWGATTGGSTVPKLLFSTLTEIEVFVHNLDMGIAL